MRIERWNNINGLIVTIAMSVLGALSCSKSKSPTAPKDTTPPSVVTIHPANGATGVAATTTISVTFSEAINISTVTAATFVVDTGGVAIPGTRVCTSTVATFTPAHVFSDGQTYNITVDSVADLAGNVMSAYYSGFTVAYPVGPPTLIASVPANGATEVSLNPTIALTFSQDMDPLTTYLTGYPNFTITGYPGSFTLGGGQRTVTVTPDRLLLPRTHYSITVDTNVASRFGVHLAHSVTVSFDTKQSPQTWGVLVGDVDQTHAQRILAAPDGYLVAATEPSRVTSLYHSDQYGNVTLVSHPLSGVPGALLNDVIATSDGNLVFLGTTDDLPSYLALVKCTPSGTVLWQKLISEVGMYLSGSSVVEASDGGLAITGDRRGSLQSQTDVLLVKASSTGDVVWRQSYGGSTSYETAFAIVRTPDCGFALGGSTYTFAQGAFAYIVATDTAGTLKWQKSFSAGEIRGMTGTSDGALVICGDAPSSGGYNEYIGKIDGSGTPLWQQTDTSSNVQEYLSHVRELSNGDFIATGTSFYYDLDMNNHLVRFSHDGAPLWHKSILGLCNATTGYEDVLALSSGFVVVGFTKYGMNCLEHRGYVVKLNANGDL